MQAHQAAAPAPATQLGKPPRGRPNWVIVVGGLLLAVGTLTTGQTHFDVLMLTGGPITLPAATGVFQFESYLTGTGGLLTAAGFLAVFVGLGFALRQSLASPRKAFPRAFAVSVIGGSLVAAGFVATSVSAFYPYRPFPLGAQGYFALDLAGRVVEAVGFFVGFASLAEMLRP